MDLFLSKESLEMGHPIFSSKPDPEVGEWYVCTETLSKAVLEGSWDGEVYLVGLTEVSPYMLVAALRSDFTVI